MSHICMILTQCYLIKTRKNMDHRLESSFKRHVKIKSASSIGSVDLQNKLFGISALHFYRRMVY